MKKKLLFAIIFVMAFIIGCAIHLGFDYQSVSSKVRYDYQATLTNLNSHKHKLSSHYNDACDKYHQLDDQRAKLRDDINNYSDEQLDDVPQTVNEMVSLGLHVLLPVPVPVLMMVLFVFVLCWKLIINTL